MRIPLALGVMASGLIATAALAQTAPTPPAAMPASPPARPHGGGWLRADADHDGIVTRAEAIAEAQARFAAMDTNHDGKVTAEERDAARAAMWQRRGADDHRGGDRGGMRPRPDGDRILTRDEAVARATARFDRMDTNHDGRLDAAELAAARPPRGSRPMAGGDMPPPPPADQ